MTTNNPTVIDAPKLQVNWVYAWNYDIRKDYGDEICIAVNQGGTSSGKTYAIIQLLFVLCLRGEIMKEQQTDSDGKEIPECFNQKLMARVVGKHLTNLRNDALSIAKKLQSTDLAAYNIQYNASRCFFIFPNGSELHFIGLDDEEKAKNGKFHYTYISEATGIKFNVFEQLFMRTTTFTFIDYNPSKRFWAHNELLDLKGSLYKKSKMVRSTYEDNINFVSPQIVEILEAKAAKNANFKKVYVEGKLGKVESLIYQNYELIKQRPEVLENISMGLDFGFNDPMVLIVTADIISTEKADEGRFLGKYAEELIYQRELTHTALADKIIQATIPFRAKTDKTIIIYADGSRPEIIKFLQPVLSQYNLAVKSTKEKGSNFMIAHGISFINSIDLYINRQSNNLISELGSYEYKRDNATGQLTDEPIDKDNHAVDSLRYSLTRDMQTERFKMAKIHTERKEKS